MSRTSPEPLAPLIRRWQRGWGLASALAPAAEADGALHVDLGRPGRKTERIVLDADQHPERLRSLAARVAAAAEPDWLTVPTNDPERTVRLVREAGLVADPDHEAFMSADLTAHPTPGAPAPYAARLSEEHVVAGRAAVFRAHLSVPGITRAAGGVGALVNTDLVVHAIRTEPDHRRRGLGSAVLGALVARAREHGAEKGLLVSTPQGHGLYSRLGWRVRASVVVAHRAP
ncbi:GNAT family N-acetyltransferase [Nocardiopsis exhalans]|uniref:GNAT family N-acetyltransferase n=1 Tax=Nocardiopsis exhalans TaxID=163604 RepID=A0ABY5DFE4_9ACTN|nr:GNAT family N-acetyltransferase [Nocardiopsis exhalans]USY23071.1 GNAT family N-acetyltransferase [Nocardiopsis exhalans]